MSSLKRALGIYDKTDVELLEQWAVQSELGAILLDAAMRGYDGNVAMFREYFTFRDGLFLWEDLPPEKVSVFVEEQRARAERPWYPEIKIGDRFDPSIMSFAGSDDFMEVDSMVTKVIHQALGYTGSPPLLYALVEAVEL